MTLSDYIMCILLFFVLALFVAVLLWMAVMILLHAKTTKSKRGEYPCRAKDYEIQQSEQELYKDKIDRKGSNL
jgi:NADH:ubiquinone oxidoreductase subunit 3 (subunit A)